MNVTINIPNELLAQADINANELHIKRSEYIRKALENMNNHIKNNEKYIRLQYLSNLVKNQSMKINSEFEEIEYAPET